MKKKDIIKALSAYVSEYDIGNLLDCSSYVHDCIMDNGFNVNRGTKKLLVESLATLSVISKALIEKLSISDEVKKEEESLIFDIISSIVAGNSREIEDEVDDNHLDDDFDFDSDDNFDFDIDDDFDSAEDFDFDTDDEDSDFDTGTEYDMLADIFGGTGFAPAAKSPFSGIDDDIDEYISEDEEDEEESDDTVELDTDEHITDDEFLKAYKKFREEDKKG